MTLTPEKERKVPVSQFSSYLKGKRKILEYNENLFLSLSINCILHLRKISYTEISNNISNYKTLFVFLKIMKVVNFDLILQRIPSKHFELSKSTMILDILKVLLVLHLLQIFSENHIFSYISYILALFFHIFTYILTKFGHIFISYYFKVIFIFPMLLYKF